MLFHKREYSLFSQLLKIVLVIYGLFLVSFSAIFLLLNYNLRTNLYDSYYRTIDNCLRETTNDLDIANRSVLSTLYNNPDLSQLSTSSSMMTVFAAESRLQRTLNSYLLCYSTVDGLFFYSERNDRFVSAVRDHYAAFSSYFKTYLRSVDFAAYSRELTSQKRSFTLCEIDGSYCFVRMFAYKNTIGGVWVDVDTVMHDLEESTSQDTLCAFLNAPETARPVANQAADPHALEQLTGKTAQIVTYMDSKYLKFEIEPAFCQANLLILMPYSYLQQRLAFRFKLQGVAIIILSLCFLATFILFSTRLRLPIRELYRISETVMENPQLEALKLQAVSRCKEVREIHEEVLRLLERIDSLENQVLREQLLKKEYELLSLRNQVSPHFLINCLSVISSMAGTSVSRTVLKSMISTLAGHLRYTLSTKPTVSLAEEMHFVRNYYDLNSYRYPDSLTYQIDIGGLCDNAAVFPSLILMLSENSIKHNLSTSEKLRLTVTAFEEEHENGQVYVHIRHTDTGGGFPEQLLEDLNNPDPAVEEIADGSKIGLYHIKKRILLAYGSSHASIRFSNLPDGGAQVDIVLPYISYQDS